VAVIVAVLLAAAIMVGTPWLVVVVLFAGAIAPLWTACGLLLLVVLTRGAPRRSRATSTGDEVRFLAGVAAELRAGSSLRGAIASAAAKAERLELGRAVRLVRAGAPMPRVAATLGRRLPATGSLLAPAIELAASSGGRSAALFDRLALRAIDVQRADDELAVSSAQAIASAWVVGLLPVPVIAIGVLSGGLARVAAAGPLGVGAVVGGSAMLISGVVVVLGMLRKARS
jgi:Flp pilus assembly protein TadB